MVTLTPEDIRQGVYVYSVAVTMALGALVAVIGILWRRLAEREKCIDGLRAENTEMLTTVIKAIDQNTAAINGFREALGMYDKMTELGDMIRETGGARRVQTTGAKR